MNRFTFESTFLGSWDGGDVKTKLIMEIADTLRMYFGHPGAFETLETGWPEKIARTIVEDDVMPWMKKNQDQN